MPLFNPPINIKNEGTHQGSTNTIDIVGPGVDGSVSSSTGIITISTATATNTGATNTEGNADTLARSNHTHAVVDLSITSQAQGSILYFNGTNWVVLTPGSNGQILQTKGSGANPIWASSANGNANGSTSAPTTTSGSYVVIPEMTTTFTTTGGNVVIWFVGTFNIQNNDDFTIGIHLDGSLVTGTEQRTAFFGGSLLGLTPAAITAGAVTAIGITSPSAGSHTFDVRWKVDAGTARAVTTMRQIIAAEILF